MGGVRGRQWAAGHKCHEDVDRAGEPSIIVTMILMIELQMGFPCISVSSKQEGADRVLSLRQTKFVGDGSEGGASRLNINILSRYLILFNHTRWHVPISVISSAAPDSPLTVMMDREEEVTTVRLAGVTDKDWVKLNPGVVGYYRWG